jgi:hypothetical protein
VTNDYRFSHHSPYDGIASKDHDLSTAWQGGRHGTQRVVARDLRGRKKRRRFEVA